MNLRSLTFRSVPGHSFNDDNHCDLTPMLGDVGCLTVLITHVGITKHPAKEISSFLQLDCLEECSCRRRTPTCPKQHSTAIHNKVAHNLHGGEIRGIAMGNRLGERPGNCIFSPLSLSSLSSLSSCEGQVRTCWCSLIFNAFDA